MIIRLAVLALLAATVAAPRPAAGAGVGLEILDAPRTAPVSSSFPIRVRVVNRTRAPLGICTHPVDLESERACVLLAWRLGHRPLDRDVTAEQLRVEPVTRAPASMRLDAGGAWDTWVRPQSPRQTGPATLSLYAITREAGRLTWSEAMVPFTVAPPSGTAWTRMLAVRAMAIVWGIALVAAAGLAWRGRRNATCA